MFLHMEVLCKQNDRVGVAATEWKCQEKGLTNMRILPFLEEWFESETTHAPAVNKKRGQTSQSCRKIGTQDCKMSFSHAE